jgi:hypothetical protein
MAGTRSIRTLATWVAVATLCIATTATARAQTQRARLVINMDCLQTTEAGEDEIYFIMVARRSDYRTGQWRFPADRPFEEAGHWNMNDGDRENSHLNGLSLVYEDLPPGQSVAWDVIVMEEDHGTGIPWAQYASQVLASTGNPYALAGAALLTIMDTLGFIPTIDSDDYIGSFSVVATNSNGRITTEWFPKDHVFQVDPPGSDQYLPPPNSCRFRLNGAGSTYHFTCYVR